MQPPFLRHITSLIFIGLLFLLIHLTFSTESREKQSEFTGQIEEYNRLPFLDLNNPQDRLLLNEALTIFRPAKKAQHDSLQTALENYWIRQIRSSAEVKRHQSGLDREKAINLSLMLVKFAAIFALVLFLTYYAVETFALYRFIRRQQGMYLADSLKKYWSELIDAAGFRTAARAFGRLILLGGKALLKAVIMLTLFAPAYVIAYSFKTSFETSAIPLMILLGVISNGLLISYTQKYYTFLTGEFRKGYVQTAIVKNLNQRFDFNHPEGIALSALFRIRKQFPGHILQHVYENVRFQYLNTLKEQASFLITGLIIIEMALNIQGHICYELMQNILYKNLAVILFILFGIFLIVKLTEMVIDRRIFRQRQLIDNLPAGER